MGDECDLSCTCHHFIMLPCTALLPISLSLPLFLFLSISLSLSLSILLVHSLVVSLVWITENNPFFTPLKRLMGCAFLIPRLAGQLVKSRNKRQHMKIMNTERRYRCNGKCWKMTKLATVYSSHARSTCTNTIVRIEEACSIGGQCILQWLILCWA